MDNCRIIEDLLPSYCDGLTSEDSNALIRSHVNKCPCCATSLDKMLAEASGELPDHREEFSRKLKEYERRHRNKTLAWGLGIAMIFLVVSLLWSNSEYIASRYADKKLGGKGIRVAHNIPVDEHKSASYYIYHTSEGFQLITLERNSILNIWYFSGSETPDTGEILSRSWFGESNWNRFVTDQTPMDVDANMNFEINHVYIGNNATELLTLDSSEIPGDVCVKINQIQGTYWIWVISDNIDAVNQLNVLEKLQLIPTS